MPRDGGRLKGGLTLRWPTLILVLATVTSIGFCRSTGDLLSTSSTLSSSSSSSGPTTRKTLNQEIGSPSELAWQAWLHLESNPGGPAALDSANLLRRITPKSIFIAPELLVSCPNGYSSDGKGDCKPDPISIDEEAQRQFFLKRLNALYGKGGGSRKKPSEPGGPLQFNIPILPPKVNPPEIPASLPPAPQQPQQSTSQLPHKQPEALTHNVQKVHVNTEKPVNRETVSPAEPQQWPHNVQDNSTNSPLGAKVVYEVGDSTTKKIVEKKEEEREDEEQQQKPKYEDKGLTSFILGNSNTSFTLNKDFIQNSSQVVPVAEIVDNANETLSGVVDYKIPVSKLEHVVVNKSENSYQVHQKIDIRHPAEKKLDDSLEDSSPAVVLLLSATKLPVINTTPKLMDNPAKTFDNSTYFSGSDQPEKDNENTTTELIENYTNSEQDIINSEGDEAETKHETTIQNVVPLDYQTSVDPDDVVKSNTERVYTINTPEEDTAYTDIEEEVTQSHPESLDHEDYDETTENADQEDFEGEEELLKAGEAGMMVTSKNQDLMRSKNTPQKHGTTLVDVADTSTTFVETTIITSTSPTVYIQDAFDPDDSTTRSDASTYNNGDDDLMSTQPTEEPSTILTSTIIPEEETTLYTLTEKPLKIKNLAKATTVTHKVNPTRDPTTITVTDQDAGTTSDNQYSFDKAKDDLVTIPELTYSTRAPRPDSSSTFGHRKQQSAYNPIKYNKNNKFPWETAEHDSDELPPILRTTPSPFRRQKPWFTTSSSLDSDSIVFSNDDEIPSEFKDQISESSKSSSTNNRRPLFIPGQINNEESYIRFPERSHETRNNHQGHVRFPSDEVNSIHNQDTYKDHLLSPYRTRDEQPHRGGSSASSTKSSVPAPQKSPGAQWRAAPPPGLRMDRQHQQYQQQHQLQLNPGNREAEGLSNQRQQKQKPMLLRFWARMPLVRDLSFYPTTSHGSHNEPIGGHQQADDHQLRGRLNSRFAAPASGVTGSSSASARRDNYYKEMSSHDLNRLLAQHMGQPSIGG